MDRIPLTRYDYYKGPKPIGDLWTLTRATLVMRCAVLTHALGWELKLTAGASFSRSQICRNESDVFATAETWLTEAKTKGWE